MGWMDILGLQLKSNNSHNRHKMAIVGILSLWSTALSFRCRSGSIKYGKVGSYFWPLGALRLRS